MKNKGKNNEDSKDKISTKGNTKSRKASVTSKSTKKPQPTRTTSSSDNPKHTQPLRCTNKEAGSTTRSRTSTTIRQTTRTLSSDDDLEVDGCEGDTSSNSSLSLGDADSDLVQIDADSAKEYYIKEYAEEG
jgi:hypothetical protein